MPLADPKPRSWFEEWREPGEFYRAANEGLQTFFCTDTTPEPYLRDAYHAGVFARIWRDDQGPCEVRLVPEPEKFPDAQLRSESGDTCLDIEITIARKKGSRMFKELRELRELGFVPAESLEELQASAREAIPRVVKEKADKRYSESKDITLLVITNGSLSAEEMARLTEPWKNCFHAICLLSLMDVVMAWPELCVLSGKEPF